jgi:hypothetical protein
MAVIAEMLSSFASVVAVLDREQSGAGKVGLYGRLHRHPVKAIHGTI